MSHYHVERKRAAVDIFKYAQELRNEHPTTWLRPMAFASVAAGGASRRRIRVWMQSDLSEEAQDRRRESRGRPRALTDEQECLLVGFAVSNRINLKPVSLSTLSRFCLSYLGEEPALSTLSSIMSAHNFSSQRTMSRNTRMVSPDVVEDALSAIEEIRSYDFPPHRVIVMDETGLWSNVTKAKTYHFKNWYVISVFLIWGPLTSCRL